MNDVDPRRAGLLLYGLQIASTNLAQSRNQARQQETAAPAESPVEDLTVDPAHGLLAPPAPFVIPTPVDSKPSLVDLLLDRLRPLAEPEASPEAVGSEVIIPEAIIPEAVIPQAGVPQAGIPSQPQPAPSPSVDPVTAASLVQPAILPDLQAAIAPSSRPPIALDSHPNLMHAYIPPHPRPRSPLPALRGHHPCPS